MSGDMKSGLTSSRPKLSLMPARAELYGVRALEYGAEKYRRGNYHGDAPAAIECKISATPDEEQKERAVLAIMGYIDATLRHVKRVTNAFQHAYGVKDLAGALAAIATVDDVASGDFPPSGLPDLGHAMASLSIAIERAVDAGLLPADPGQPWREGKVTEDRSPEAVARFAAIHPTAGSIVVNVHPPAPPLCPAPLCRGYHRADVLAVARRLYPNAQHRVTEKGLECKYGEVGWHVEDWSDGDCSLHELYREHGLRRPDEPDYKPVTP